MNQKIYFVADDEKLRQMAYGDSVYAWLLLHSKWREGESHNYIYKKDFTYEEIAQDIGKTRQTVSTRLKKLIACNDNPYTKDLIVDDGERYLLPQFRDYKIIDCDTLMNLFRICGTKKRREEVIKTYVWLRKRWENKDESNKISSTELIEAFGYDPHNTEIYNRFKDVLTTLQGAGLIKFKTDKGRDGGKFSKTIVILQVNEKASQDWLDKKEDKKD